MARYPVATRERWRREGVADCSVHSFATTVRRFD